MTNDNSPPKYTIGIFTPSLKDSYHEMLCKGFEDFAKEHNINTIYIIGGPLHVSFFPYEAHANILYDLLDSTSINGLIISSATIGAFTTQKRVRDFVHKYKKIPIVSLGLSIPDVMNILLDNKKGMKDIIKHLIEVHNVRRIAFIQGPEDVHDARIRYEAYQEVLNENNIPIEQELILQGNFTDVSGKFCAATLLNSGVQFEAIVAANDGMALGAIEELKKRGYEVPKDFLVTGFDNNFESKFSSPPLTTVKQPVYEQGRKAMETIISIVKKNENPDNITLSTELIIRKSCGCIPESSAESIINSYNKLEESKKNDLVIDLRYIISEIQKSNIYDNFKMNPILVQDLLGTFIQEITGKKKNIFINKFKGLIEDLVSYDSDLRDWVDIIAMFKKFSLIYKSKKRNQSIAEDILQKASEIINNTIEQFKTFQFHESERKLIDFTAVIDFLNSNFDISKFNDIISKSFPSLGFNYTYISLFEGKDLPSENSRLIIAFNLEEHIVLPKEGYIFPTKQLIPKDFFNKEKRYSFLVQSLHFKNNPQYGFVIFEFKPELLHFNLSIHISNALKATFLCEELTKIRNKT